MRGTLVVKPVCATLTHDIDLFGRADPYVKLYIGSQIAATHPAIGAGRAPNWGESFAFAIGDESRMYFEVFDKDPGQDEFIGAGVVDLNPIFLAKHSSQLYPVSKPVKKPWQRFASKDRALSVGRCSTEGQLMLDIEYIPVNRPLLHPIYDTYPTDDFVYSTPARDSHTPTTQYPYPFSRSLPHNFPLHRGSQLPGHETQQPNYDEGSGLLITARGTPRSPNHNSGNRMIEAYNQPDLR